MNVDVGTKIGWLEVLAPVVGPRGIRAYRVRCTLCGTEREYRTWNLTQGNVASCGCARRARVWTDEEMAVLRKWYGKMTGAKLRKKLPGRSLGSILQKAEKSGLGKPTRYTVEEVQYIRDGWGTVPIAEMAKHVGRRVETVYHYANNVLGLKAGVPQGYESLAAAARRMGFAASTLRYILNARGVPVRPRPTSGVKSNGGKAKFHAVMVDSFDAESAVEWYTHSETIYQASRRTGYDASSLRRILVRAGVKLETRPMRPNFRRIMTSEIDRAMAEWEETVRVTETLTEGAARIGVSQSTLSRWLSVDGVETGNEKTFRLKPSTVDACAAKRLGKETVNNAAKRLHVSPFTLVRWLRRDGVIPGTSSRASRYYLRPSDFDEAIARRRTTEAA